MRAFRGFQINSEILKLASREAVVMHCLPAHRGMEITDKVLEGKQSVVWLQAENKLYEPRPRSIHEAVSELPTGRRIKRTGDQEGVDSRRVATSLRRCSRRRTANRQSISIKRAAPPTHLKIKEALPHVFNRAYPVLDPKMPMLPAVSMLRFQQIDGLPLVIDVNSGGRPRALQRVFPPEAALGHRPGGFWKFIERPCEDAAQTIGVVGANESIEHLFSNT